ncbi:MAG TPA: CbiX/SirB N-terminal domain-containing protein [Clostridia bacterium]|nr:CbiX/SirB N-terminal domain-containing protein [Clostridia bacterium]
MADRNFENAVVVLVGHGSTVNAQSAAPVYQHAAALRGRKLFAEVREAFWKQEPRVADVVGNLASATVFVVPVFISEGYFSERVIPRALGFPAEIEDSRRRVQSTGSRQVIYCRALGEHPGLSRVLLARATGVAERFPFPSPPKPGDTTLFVAGHGTGQDEHSRRAIERQVERVGAMNLYAAVHAVFLEESPRIGDCYRLTQTRNLVMVPFFISDGMHVREDIPILLGEPEALVRKRLAAGQPTWRNPTERHGKRVWYSDSVGTDPLVGELILERVQEAATWVAST